MGNCLGYTRNGAKHNGCIQPQTQTPGGSKEGSRSSSVTYPLPPPPQHISAYTDQNLTSPSPSQGHENEMMFSPHLKSFTFNELMYATRHFCDDYLLGEGGFGHVYKGWLHKETLTPVESGSGMAVAVKKLKPGGFQGQKEWLSEITYLGQLDHANLVNLLGFSSDGENRLLVYEFMPQGSLENQLFRGGAQAAQPLSWALRLKVVVEAARGLSFLHASEPKIIYRDFKCSNILLDMDYNAKLSDFGLAKAGPTGDLTHVTTQVMGTQGYTAPEYIATGRLTTKCDVFSFGIVLLELITGRRAIDKNRIVEERKLLEWVRPQLIDKKRLFRIMDSKLEGKYSRRGAYIVANLALQCCHPIAKYRPHMCEVVSVLEKIPSSSRAHSLNKMSSSKSQTNTIGSSPILLWPSQGSPLMPQR